MESSYRCYLSEYHWQDVGAAAPHLERGEAVSVRCFSSETSGSNPASSANESVSASQFNGGGQIGRSRGSAFWTVNSSPRIGVERLVEMFLGDLSEV
jgi:hypothetical protein